MEAGLTLLNVVTLERAMEIAANEMPRIRRETVLPTDEAAGLILAADIVSGADVPAFDRSTMDGYAVIAADTFGAGQAVPAMLDVIGEIPMGAAAAFSLAPGQCARISTGGMLPAGADAVVPVEYTDLDAGNLMLCYTAVSPLRNVTRRGEDVKKGQTVLKRGDRLSPAAVGVLSAMGVTEAAVFAPPRVGILSTGNELVPITAAPAVGEVRDVNAHVLRAFLRGRGCDCRCYGIIRDEAAALTEALRRAAEENDIVLLSGGSSAGEADKTAEIVASLGTVFCHGIAVKPGKPTVLGQIGSAAVFGLPGHPAACYFTASLLVGAYLDARAGLPRRRNTVKARITEHVSSNHGREELLCVKLLDGRAAPIYAKSGVISFLSAADGYVIIPRDAEGIAEGEKVEIFPFE